MRSSQQPGSRWSKFPGEPRAIHRRAASWLRSRGLEVEAVEHAAAAGDHGVVAELLSTGHLALIRNGRSATILRWARTLPDEVVIEHPVVAVASATAALLVGKLTLERRRFLRLAHRAQITRPERFDIYEETVMAMVRSAGIDDGVTEALLEGHRAVELARRGADHTLADALAGLARALYFHGDLDQAWSAASRAAEYPDASQRAPGYAVARTVLALVAADRGRLGSARGHADAARALVGRIMSSRSWLGANAAAALGDRPRRRGRPRRR